MPWTSLPDIVEMHQWHYHFQWWGGGKKNWRRQWWCNKFVFAPAGIQCCVHCSPFRPNTRARFHQWQRLCFFLFANNPIVFIHGSQPAKWSRTIFLIVNFCFASIVNEWGGMIWICLISIIGFLSVCLSVSWIGLSSLCCVPTHHHKDLCRSLCRCLLHANVCCIYYVCNNTWGTRLWLGMQLSSEIYKFNNLSYFEHKNYSVGSQIFL